jgi:co-chaperonin GroES (HSP10)
MAKALQMVHEVDPRKVIYDKIKMKEAGKLPGFELFGNRVLVGIYERPKQTVSGIHLPDQYRAEDEHQGKAALVLAMGHSAFKSDEHFSFGPDKIEPGDWVSLWVFDGRKIIINGQLCRIVKDQDIVMKIPAPDAVM